MRIGEAEAGERLDVVVARLGAMSRARAGGLVDDGLVHVNGTIERKSYRVAVGDDIEVAERPAEPKPPPPEVDVVFEDDHLLVVDKPAGLVVHEGAGVRGATLVDALGATGRPLAPAAGEGRPGIVHRLDRDVSGLLVVAKTDAAHGALVSAMQRREIERRYLALVAGSPPSDTGKIEAPIGRHPRHRTKMAVVPEGKPAVTWFTVRERHDRTSLLEVRLETGRTHQIRAHLASIGHDVAGDPAYARDPALGRSLDLRRPFLHAYSLVFRHPVSGEQVDASSYLPADLEAVLRRVR